MLYRLFKPEDFESLYAVEEICFQPPFRFGRRYMRRIVEATNGATWIAEEDGAMAGFAVVEWTHEGTESIAYLETIEVTPKKRGRGLGSGLLQHAEASALAAGASAMWLHVDATNSSAIRLYEEHGYQFFSKREDYYAPGRGALIYRKALSQGGGAIEDR